MAIAWNLCKRVRRLLLLVCCGLSSAELAAEEWAYTVRPGDEIWNIASRYCGSPAFAARIIEFNQLADERRLRPGTRLRIPVSWLVREPVTAKILNVRGEATLFTPGAEAARVGREIEMGYRLATADGAAVVGFADGSSLVVAAETEVLFNVLTAFGDTGMVDTNLRFYRGRGTSRVVRRNDASRFRISSPAGTAAVRGTEFRIAVEGDRSLTETLEGEVGFLRDVETSVPAGFGLAASPAELVREELLPAPVWQSGPGTYAPGAAVSWDALAGAQAYRASVYEATDTDAPVRSLVTDSTSLALVDLAAGEYVIALRGISSNDLEGFDATLAVALGTAPPGPTAPAILTAGSVALTWSSTATGSPYEVRITRDAGGADLVALESARTAELPADLDPGRYYWSVKDATSSFSPPAQLTVRPRQPSTPEIARDRLNVSLTWSSPDAQSHRLVISRSADFSDPVVATTTDESAYATTLAVGQYHVQLVALANGVESEAVTTQTTVTHPPPWWLLGMLLLPLFL